MDRPSLISMPDAWPFPPAGISPGARAGLTGGHRPEAASGGESTLTEHSGGGRRKRKRNDSGASEDESSKLITTTSGNDLSDSNIKCHTENGNSKIEPEANSAVSNKPTKQMTQPSEPSKLDYIHVRARRGQATDSHSLAERARREKISERMKILQDLVPGCNKVIGKASVLDEIINYIQALQNQVEFMSMKLEAVNSHMNVAFEGYPPKDFDEQTYDASSSLALRPIQEYGQEPAADWLHMQVGGGAFERVT